MLAHLEQLSGRRIRTREDLAAYIADVSLRAEKKRSKWKTLKDAALWSLLVIALLQYYFVDIQLQILEQPTLTVFYPVRDVAQADKKI